MREAEKKLEARSKQVMSILEAELASEKSAQGGPKAARRAVHLLVRMGRSTRACDLFLKLRSNILNAALRSVKLDGATVAYVQRLTAVFFNSVLEAGVEFRKAFSLVTSKPEVGGGMTNGHARTNGSPGEMAKFSSLLLWLRTEIDNFSDR